MRITLLLKAIPFLVTLLGLSTASSIPDFPFIMANGRVERDVSPTNATINFTVLAFSKNSEEATNSVQSALSTVIATLKAEGVAENLIEAHDLDKSAVRQRNKETYSDVDVLGYEVSRTVLLTIPDLANYPKVVRALMIAEHVTNVKSTFDTSKREEVEAELMGEACAKARKKALLLAKGANVNIDRAFAISDGGFENLDGMIGTSGRVGDVALGGPPDLALFAPSKITLQAGVNIL